MLHLLQNSWVKRGCSPFSPGGAVVGGGRWGELVMNLPIPLFTASMHAFAWAHWLQVLLCCLDESASAPVSQRPSR
jgi:hypothetical protein